MRASCCRRITSDDPELADAAAEAAEPRLTAEQIEPDQAMDRRRGRVEGALGIPSADRGREHPKQRPIGRRRRRSIGSFGADWRPNGLEPSPPADRRTLIRRLSFDLIGLPPDAGRGRAVRERQERRSPTSGWLTGCWLRRISASGWRSSGSTWCASPTPPGYHGDNHVDIYLFRDYVIRSFNANKPFDRFTIEQLAGRPVPVADRRDADRLGL